jgi:hypothetical protein
MEIESKRKSKAGMSISGAVIVIIFVLIPVAFAYLHFRDRKLALSALAKAIGGRVAGDYAVAVHDYIPYRLQYCDMQSRFGQQSAPDELAVFVNARAHESFEVLEETRTDELLRQVGLLRKITTGDEEFDDRFQIHGGAREFIGKFFASAENRQMVREVFRQEFVNVRHAGDSLSARLPLAFLDQGSLSVGQLDERSAKAITARLSTVVPALGVLARNLQHARPPGQV